MGVRRSLLVAVAAFAALSCSQWDTGSAARRTGAQALECAEPRVDPTQIAEYRYRATGCRRTVVVACTAAALEPQCFRESEPTTAGGEVAFEENAAAVTAEPGSAPPPASSSGAPSGPSGAQAPGANAQATAPGLTSSAGAQAAGADPVPEPPEPGSASADGVEERVRAGLDAHRADVLACTGADWVAVRVGYAPDGSVDVALQGPLHGSPEERCVQHVLDGVRVPATGESGVVIHLLRAPPPGAP